MHHPTSDQVTLAPLCWTPTTSPHIPLVVATMIYRTAQRAQEYTQQFRIDT